MRGDQYLLPYFTNANKHKLKNAYWIRKTNADPEQYTKLLTIVVGFWIDITKNAEIRCNDFISQMFAAVAF